jgi:hypothetical protein
VYAVSVDVRARARRRFMIAAAIGDDHDSVESCVWFIDPTV